MSAQNQTARRKPARKGPGRPPVHTENWDKVSIVLMVRQVRELDRFAAALTKRCGQPVKRAEVIRALFDEMLGSRDLRRRVLESVLHRRSSLSSSLP